MSDVFETIQSYLDGSMTAEEKKQFEEQLRNDPALAETFRTYIGIESSMQAAPANDKNEEGLRLSLEKLNKEHFGERPSVTTSPSTRPAVTRRIFGTWQAAAAILVIVIGSAVWLLLKPAGEEADLYRKYAQHTQLDTSPRSGGNDTLASDAANAFNAGQYAVAASLLETYHAHDSSDTEMYLALGICYLELDKLPQARQIFSNIAQGTSTLIHKARWYIALSWLKQKQYGNCRTVLESIPPGTDVYDRAEDLLKELAD